MAAERGRELEDLAAAHTPAAIRERFRAGPDRTYLRDFVYGAVDGAVTTFAVVSGVAGAELSTGVVVVLGLANLVGDGFSMAAANYLGTRAEQQLRDRARLTEEREIDLYPEGEREEVRQIFEAKGFTGGDLERAVEIVTADRRRWVEAMLVDELGLSLDGPSPIRAAAATFGAFAAVGLIPLLPFISGYVRQGAVVSPFFWSALLTAAAFFGVGAAKSRFVGRRWYTSGLETLLVGGSAAVLAYFVGVLLKGLV